MIERFYYQLTDGCGQANCTNPNCASSSTFVFRNITKNTAAVQALELFKNKAVLCDASVPAKVAKEARSYGAKSVAECTSSANIPSSSNSSSTSVKSSGAINVSQGKNISG